mgnify:CR=1 FL=1
MNMDEEEFQEIQRMVSGSGVQVCFSTAKLGVQCPTLMGVPNTLLSLHVEKRNVHGCACDQHMEVSGQTECILSPHQYQNLHMQAGIDGSRAILRYKKRVNELELEVEELQDGEWRPSCSSRRSKTM